MRKKEFIKEAIPTIEPVGSLEQAIDNRQNPPPAGPSLLQKAGSALKTAGSRFGQGFTAGFNSGLGPGLNPTTAAGAATRADAAALQPEKIAFDIYNKIQKGEDYSPESIPPELYSKVVGILKSNIPQQKNWDEHVKNKTSPYSKAVPGAQQSMAHSANAPVNPQVADYLNKAAGGQKIKPTGNEELDRVLKTAGLL